MSRAVMQQALEALENAGEAVYAHGGIAAVGSLNTAAQALRAALSEPQTTHWEGCEAVHPECKAKPITADEMSAWVKDTWEKCQAEAWQGPVAYCTLEQLATLKLTVPSSDKIALYTAPPAHKPEQEPVRLQCTTCGTVYADGVPPQVPEQKAWFTVEELNEWATKLPQPAHEVKDLSNYEFKTYKIGGFQLEAGFYSADELRDLVKAFDKMNAATERSMRRMK